MIQPNLNSQRKNFSSKNPQYEYLRKRLVQKHKNIKDGLVDKHLRHALLGGLGGLLLLNTPTNLNSFSFDQTTDHEIGHVGRITPAISQNAILALQLKDKLPLDVKNLSSQEEKSVSDLVFKELGIKITPEITGIRLNRTFGLIGGEQHLYRYPGDIVFAHAKSASDWAMFGDAGIAPGLGAWGYFAPSIESFSPDDELKERYYIAVQTFLSPGFAEHFVEYRDFFKFRKMLVINPKTGQAVVADIADAGPSEWTGKHLGGSPEVMQDLGLATGPRKGPVLYFFINEDQKDIPLGPVFIGKNK